MNRDYYIEQVTLLLDCLPALKEQTLFALKGGTAINFFIHDLPRLSVDIDLTYVKMETREKAINEIEAGLKALGKIIVKRNKKYQIKEIKTREGKLQKIIIKNGRNYTPHSEKNKNILDKFFYEKISHLKITLND